MGGSSYNLARPECVAQPGAVRESAARGRGRKLWRHKDGTLTMHALLVALIGRAAEAWMVKQRQWFRRLWRRLRGILGCALWGSNKLHSALEPRWSEPWVPRAVDGRLCRCQDGEFGQ